VIPALSGPDLLRQASAILEREAQRLSPALAGGLPALSGAVPLGAPGGAPSLGDFRQPTPVLGAAAPLPGTDDNRLKQQADDLLAGILTGFGQSPGGVPDLDGLRKQAQDFFETLLLTLNERRGAKSVPADNRVPLLQCEAPVQAGTEARAVLTVSNEETTSSDVTLYCTNFVADSGHDLSARRVTFSPRKVTIPAGSEATFQIRIAVPLQMATGVYSGLIQAMGSRYVKAVLSLEVL
jgi:hypothetical protein